MHLMTKIAACGLATCMLASAAMAQQIVLEANKSQPLRIAGDASSVVIGNPRVADVAVHSQNLIFLTGKTFGTTNLIIFNEAGEQLYSGDIVVTADTANLVTVNRAGATNTYDCAPACRSVLAIGDEQVYFDQVITQNEDIQALANGGN